MPTWPSTLPQDLQVQGFNATLPQGAVRTDMEVGPSFQRRRATATPERFEGRIWVDATQYETLRQFWRDTLGMGALKFDWQHPITKTSSEVQFNAGEPPGISAVSGNLFAVDMIIEVLP